MNFGKHIASITVLEDNYLYAVVYDSDKGNNIVSKMFQDWADNEFLVDFFVANKEGLESGYYSEEEISRAVADTVREAMLLKAKLLRAQKSRNLGDMFLPLSKGKTENFPILIKAYGVSQRAKLRLYAVRLDDGTYIISGGAIKIAKTMDGSDDLKLQKVRLKRLRDFLRQEGIDDVDQLEELILEL